MFMIEYITYAERLHIPKCQKSHAYESQLGVQWARPHIEPLGYCRFYKGFVRARLNRDRAKNRLYCK